MAVTRAAIVGQMTIVLNVNPLSWYPKAKTLTKKPVITAPTGIKVPGILKGSSVVYQVVPDNKNNQPQKAIISLIYPTAKYDIPQEKTLK